MKKIVIAGSGPSLKNIDYRRLPKDIDILRTNHFYKEDYYYLGKNVNYYFPYVRSGFFEYLPVVLAKTMEGTYNIFKYFSNDLFLIDYFSYLADFEYVSPYIFDISPVIKDIDNSKSILNYLKLYRDYHKKDNSCFWLNAGTMSIVKAIELGYKEIYIVGIELQDADKWNHFYNETNTQKYDMSAHKKFHSSKLEKDLIKYMSNLPDIKMYSISDSCGINEILELAPIQNDNPYIPIKKTKEEMELSKDSLIFLEDVKKKIFKEWKKSKIFFYQTLSMDIDAYEKRFEELEEEERAEEKALEKKIKNINNLVWWIPIREWRDKLRVKLLNKLKEKNL